MWVAPAKGSGCVRLSAMIYEGKDAWYSDVGGLTKIICEEKVDKAKKMLANDECCACDEAKYSVSSIICGSLYKKKIQFLFLSVRV